MPDASFHAVLTGDIVKSSALSPKRLEAVRAGLAEAAGEIRGWRRGLVAGGPEFFRGDAWQLALADAGAALRAALYLRAALIAYEDADTRIAIGVGAVTTLSRRRVSLSAGEAFEASGRALDAMPGPDRLAVAARTQGRWPPVVARLCDAIAGRWTARQAEIVCAALAPDAPTHQEIADALSPPVTRQAVSDALAAAQWRAIEDAVALFEETNWKGEAARTRRRAPR